MRIVEQTHDRLLIEARKTMPDFRYGLAPGLLFSMPVFVAYWNARRETGAWKLLIVIAVIWLIIVAIYAAVMRFSKVPSIDLDVKSGRARIGGGDVPLDDIETVTIGRTGDLVFPLRASTRRAFVDDDNVPNETHFLDAATSAAEKSRAAKVIRAFLAAQREVSSADPYRGETPEYYVEAEHDKETVDPERAAAQRWVGSWDGESTVNRPCYYCGLRPGDTAPVQLSATNDRFDLLESIFIPRCRRCARIHRMHKQVVPALFVLPTWVASFTFFMVRLTGRLHTVTGLIAGFVGIALGAPALAFGVARLMTRPAFFGSKNVGVWQTHPAVEQGRRTGWTFAAQWLDRG